MPSPTMLRMTWATSAITAPANTAPQETECSATVRMSSAGETALAVGRSRS